MYDALLKSMVEQSESEGELSEDEYVEGTVPAVQEESPSSAREEQEKNIHVGDGDKEVGAEGQLGREGTRVLSTATPGRPAERQQDVLLLAISTRARARTVTPPTPLPPPVYPRLEGEDLDDDADAVPVVTENVVLHPRSEQAKYAAHRQSFKVVRRKSAVASAQVRIQVADVTVGGCADFVFVLVMIEPKVWN